jgi:hypothetical protein
MTGVSPETEVSNLPATRSRVAVAAGGNLGAIIPQDFDQALRISQAIAASGMAPKGMTRPEQVLVAIMYGAELDLPPMQALQSIAVINGRPSVWGDGLLAIILRRGVDVEEWHEGDGEARTAFCKATRPDTGKSLTQTFSVADAKKAGLWGKEGPWRTYPDRMLKMRARSWCLRDLCADMLRGVQVREEVEDTVQDVTPPQSGLAARLAAAKTGQEQANGFSHEGAVAALAGEDPVEAEIVEITDLGLMTGAELLDRQREENAPQEPAEADEPDPATTLADDPARPLGPHETQEATPSEPEASPAYDHMAAVTRIHTAVLALTTRAAVTRYWSSDDVQNALALIRNASPAMADQLDAAKDRHVGGMR